MWTGPFKFRDHLGAVDHVIGYPIPPSQPGVYLVSRGSWGNALKSEAFYIGKADNLRQRIGDFVFSMLGFDDEPAGRGISHRHWGGRKLLVHCYRSTPLDYYVAWRVGGCGTCIEAALIEVLSPTGNERKPQRCRFCDPVEVDRLLGIATPY
jgi:hypothetical protein